MTRMMLHIFHPYLTNLSCKQININLLLFMKFTRHSNKIVDFSGTLFQKIKDLSETCMNPSVKRCIRLKSPNKAHKKLVDSPRMVI